MAGIQVKCACRPDAVTSGGCRPYQRAQNRCAATRAPRLSRTKPETSGSGHRDFDEFGLFRQLQVTGLKPKLQRFPRIGDGFRLRVSGAATAG